MKRAQQIKAAVAAVVVSGAAAAALLIPGSPAVAYSSGGVVLDVKVLSPAVLVDKGAAVAVPVQYTCTTTLYTAISADVSERVGGNDIAQGYGSTTDPLTCNGEIQSTTVTVTARTKAFAKGTAVAHAHIAGCGSVCGNEDDTESITIDNK